MSFYHARGQGKSQSSKQWANQMLDQGHTIRVVSLGMDIMMQRFNGVDFILNDDGSYDIDGSGIMKDSR